jgi:hypothetical protein
MSEQITLTLPQQVMENAERWARRMGQPVEVILAQFLESSLAPLGPATEPDRPLSEWTNEDILSAADEQLPPGQDDRLSELLHQQQAGELTREQSAELQTLMLAYQEALLRKARGLAEAVRRGLRGPVQP